MGAAAFIMAEYTGIAYVDIALAALIPALLYYVPIYMQVHLVAQREGLQGVAEDQTRRVGATLKDGGLFPAAAGGDYLGPSGRIHADLFGAMGHPGGGGCGHVARQNPHHAFHAVRDPL